MGCYNSDINRNTCTYISAIAIVITIAFGDAKVNHTECFLLLKMSISNLNMSYCFY